MNTSEASAVEDYFSICARREQLLASQATALSTNPLYMRALENADTRLHELEQNPFVVSHLQMLAKPIIEEYQREQAAIDQLAALAGDFLSEEEIALQRHAVLLSVEQKLEDPKVRAAWQFTIGAGVQAEVLLDTASVESTPETQAILPKPDETPRLSAEDARTHETGPTPIEIKRQGNAVIIGQHGKYVLLSHHQESDAMRDYSEDRWAILKTLAQNYEREIPVKDLWSLTFPNKDFDGHVMAGIRSWLNKLTFRRSPIVIHNGKRGNASAYHVNGFQITLTHVTVPRANQSLAVSVQPEQSPNADRDEETIPQSQSCGFPLSMYECSVLASFFTTNAAVFERQGIQTIDKDAAEAISDRMKQATYNQERAIAIYKYGDLRGVRENIIEKLMKFFEDDAAVLNTMELMSIRDDRLPLFEYLFDIEGEQRWKLLEELLDAKHFTDVNVNMTRRGAHVRDTTLRVIGANGRDLMLSPTPELSDPATEEPAENNSLPVEPQDTPRTPALDDIVMPETPAPVAPAANHAPAQPSAASEAQTAKAVLLGEIERAVIGWVEEVDRYNLAGKSPMSIRAVLPGITDQTIGAASERGIISHDRSKTLSVEDIVTVLASGEYPAEFGRTKAARGRVTRKDIEQVIKKVLK